MKILQVVRQFSPSVGGIESVVYHLSKALLARGHQVEVLTLNRLWNSPAYLPSEELIDGIQVHRIPFRGSSRYAIAPSVLWHDSGYDLIHLHSSDFFLDFLAGTAPFQRIPLVLSTHGFYFHSAYAQHWKKIYFRTATRLALTQVRRILCDSQHDIDLVAPIAPAAKTVLLPNGIQSDLLGISFVPRDRKRILSVGRISRNKRYDLLLNVFAHLAQTDVECSLGVIGGDQGELPSLRALSKGLGIEDRVQWMGNVSHDVLVAQLSHAGIWASASEYESFGIGLLEAMASGCVPVVSQIAAHTELVRNGVSGRLIDYEDIDTCVNVLRELMSLSEEDYRSLQVEARTNAAHYTWEQIGAQVERIYRQCLEETGR